MNNKNKNTLELAANNKNKNRSLGNNNKKTTQNLLLLVGTLLTIKIKNR